MKGHEMSNKFLYLIKLVQYPLQQWVMLFLRFPLLVFVRKLLKASSV